jgi:hypothetical protein
VGEGAAAGDGADGGGHRRGPRPYFHVHPREPRIASSAVPSPSAPDSHKPRWCCWCGWVRSAAHFNAAMECELWQWGVGAADRLKQWRLAPTLRKRRRPTLVVPDVGCTFMQANHGQISRKK